jgi:hypothetical protein
MLALDVQLVSARPALRVLAGWFKVLLYACALAKNFVVIFNSCAKVRQTCARKALALRGYLHITQII